MGQTGIVFDIQRFSLFDGPGIRTSVFLKGCPLHCAWCHNPESQSHRCQLAYHEDKCVHCLRCTACCPCGVHKAVGGRHCVDFADCKLTGSCVGACPNGALKMIGREMSVEEVLTEVKKDSRYYGTSGGITLSGGEPMSRFLFSLELCKTAKQAGLHTCIETSGYAPQKRFAKLLPYVDLFLYDYKVTDPQQHRRLTGVDNAVILDNLRFLCSAQAKVLLRAPIIPGCNDTEEHFAGIVQLSKAYPKLQGVELMPYHDLGKSKAASIGKCYTVDAESVNEAKKQEYIARLIEMGCDTNVLIK